jgi:hypothetical protein
MTEALNDAKKLYADAISRIVYNNIILEQATILEKELINNLETIAKTQEVKEGRLNKEEKTNKVERTMATQSLNVRVTAKLDLIQKKYPINPKDHPELLNKINNDKSNENIKLVVENKKRGFATTAAIISLIALICGLGFGIAYVLIVMGG